MPDILIALLILADDQKCLMQGKITYTSCHCYDFLVRFIGKDLYFLNFFNFYFLSRLVMTPHVLYVHMTYVYSFFICLCFSFHMIT